MTSAERKEARFQRRKAKRLEKKEKFQSSLPSFNEIFTINNLEKGFRNCKAGVQWKSSIQGYEADLPINLHISYNALMNRTWKTKGFTKFIIMERGKLRHIKSVHISERVIQNTFCDQYLVPLLRKNIIYDNSASLKGRGTDFAIERLRHFLIKYYNEYGSNDGFAGIIDFSDYFRSIPHNRLYELVDDKLVDEDCKRLYHQFIDVFEEDGKKVGLGLGSQVNQISAVTYPNKLDHLMKDQLGLKYYGRYMDDTIILHPSKEKIKEVFEIFKEESEKLGLTIKPNKMKILKLSNGFTYLKKRFRLTKDGKVIVRLTSKNINVERRKIKKLRKKYDNHILNYEHCSQAYFSYRGMALKYKNYYNVRQLDKLFYEVFIEEDMKKGRLSRAQHKDLTTISKSIRGGKFYGSKYKIAL